MKHLKVGDASPSWEGKNEKGETVKKEDFLGHKLAIYFYPKDNTPGCTTQSCNIRDNYSTLQEKEITILGVSADSIKSHQKFIAGKELPFSLIADEEKKMLNLFGVWGEKKFMGRTYDGIHRTTFLMNEEGIIIGIIEKPKTKFHAEEIIELFEK